MGDFTVIALSVSIICLTWAVVRINEKVDSTISKLKRMDRLAPKSPQEMKPKASFSVVQETVNDASEMLVMRTSLGIPS